MNLKWSWEIQTELHAMKPQILILELYIEYCKTKHLFVELTIKKIEKKGLSGLVLNLEINT